MATKVLTSKRKTATVTYEFSDGSTTSITIQALSTNEDIECGGMAKNEMATAADLFEKMCRFYLAKNDAETVNRIIEENYSEGHIMDLSVSLGQIINEAKKGK